MTENPPASPEVFEIMASLEPVESLTTVAFTPILAVLMALARSFRVSPAFLFPEESSPVAKVVAVPPVGVIVMADVARTVVGSDSISEYQDPVVARLLMTTVCAPEVVPVAAVAVR